ncbi:hypothetical protein AOLI_G00285280 [Acnodon oligacanthus]
MRREQTKFENLNKYNLQVPPLYPCGAPALPPEPLPAEEAAVHAQASNHGNCRGQSYIEALLERLNVSEWEYACVFAVEVQQGFVGGLWMALESSFTSWCNQ